MRTILVDPPRHGTIKPGPELRRLIYRTAFVATAVLALAGLGVVTVVRWFRA
jgi:hypothetical protein